MWQLAPFMKPDFMRNWFMHSTLNNRMLPMLTSCFSHSTPGHILFNMFALYTFGQTVYVSAGMEQMIAIYIAGGVFSSWVSHMFKLAVRDYHPSLGASGSVFAFVALTTYVHPNAELSIIFLPFFSFYAKTLFPVLVGFDAIGCVGRATRLFSLGLDHAAHLGGAAFGWYYTKYLKDKRDRKMARLARKY